MTIIHQDTFKRNDVVVWRDHGTIADAKHNRVRSRLGGVRFMTIRSTECVGKSCQYDVGHSQMVTVYEDPDTNTWSGAWFRHATAAERE